MSYHNLAAKLLVFIGLKPDRIDFRIWLLLLNGFVASTLHVSPFSFAIFLGTESVARL